MFPISKNNLFLLTENIIDFLWEKTINIYEQ